MGVNRQPGSGGPELLGVYLNDHLGAATGGVELVRRAAGAQRGTPGGRALRQLADEITEDRQSLLTMMRSLGVPVRRYKVVGGWVAEKAGRLKFNRKLLRRSRLSAVLELEALLVGIEGKQAGWRLLRQQAEVDQRLDAALLDELIARAGQQAERVEALRVDAAAAAFR